MFTLGFACAHRGSVPRVHCEYRGLYDICTPSPSTRMHTVVQYRLCKPQLSTIDAQFSSVPHTHRVA
eukprot:1254255-Rhodomonas_salina.3